MIKTINKKEAKSKIRKGKLESFVNILKKMTFNFELILSYIISSKNNFLFNYNNIIKMFNSNSYITNFV